MKTSLILGIGGQDGSYLAEELLARGHDVHGLARHSSVDNLWRVRGILKDLTIHRGDVTDWVSLGEALDKSDPDEVYNLADQDNVGWSAAAPMAQLNVTVGGCINLLEMLRGSKTVRVFQPLSVTMFHDRPPPQNERTPICCASHYACAKAACWHYCHQARRDGLHVVCGIMSNHDSVRRNEGYLLGKIAKQVIELANGKREKIVIGNPSTVVDIGHAPEFMRIVADLMDLDEEVGPDDYCIGTGQGASVRELIRAAINHAGGRYEGEHQIEIDPQYPDVAPTFVADTTHLRATLGDRMPGLTHAVGVVKLLVNHLGGREIST